MDGGVFLTFPAGRNFSAAFPQVTMNKKNLTRREIFRGKILRRKTQTKNNRLEERTPSAPNP